MPRPAVTGAATCLGGSGISDLAGESTFGARCGELQGGSEGRSGEVTVQQLRDLLEEMPPDAEIVLLKAGMDDPRLSRPLHLAPGAIRRRRRTRLASQR